MQERMRDLDALNPYPEIQPRLHEAWNEGFRAGGALNKDVGDSMPEEARNDALQYQAWRSGFRERQERDAALSQNGEVRA